MANKIIISMLVFLLLLMGGTSYYLYNLNDQLAAAEAAQTARVDAMADQLNTLRLETINNLGNLQAQIWQTLGDLTDLQEQVSTSANQTEALETEVSEVIATVSDLESAITGIADSAIDATAVFQKVGAATVRISDGQSTIGSGFISDTSGHVVTAYHVVQELSKIFVILHDGSVIRANVVGYSQVSDVAVLSMSFHPNIEPPLLADSGNLKVGQPVAAIGSPFELRDTITTGIISQLNRYTEIQYDSEDRPIPNLIQFDAAVNPGNSGCPLVDANGNIIGLVIARISPLEGDGVNYAVSSNKVKRVVNSILATGTFNYPWLGIAISDLTPQSVVDSGLGTSNGVWVGEVISGSPAQAAGLMVEDILITVDDISLIDTSTLTSYVGEFKSPGDVMSVGIIRGSTRLTLNIILGQMP
jgi:S1-C subfamily serine protease